MIFWAKSTSLSKGNLLPLEPVEVSHAYALEEGNHQKGNVGAAKTIIRVEYSCEEYSEDNDDWKIFENILIINLT